MFLSKHSSHNTTVISLTGPLDPSAKPGLTAAILGAQEAGARQIVLNFTNVYWVDSAGLGQIFLTYHHLNRKKIQISIVNPQPEVRKILEQANIPSIVPIYHNEEEAIQEQAHRPAGCLPL